MTKRLAGPEMLGFETEPEEDDGKWHPVDPSRPYLTTADNEYDKAMAHDYLKSLPVWEGNIRREYRSCKGPQADAAVKAASKKREASTLKLTKNHAGNYSMDDHRGRKVEVIKTDTYRGARDWVLWVDGERSGEWGTFKEAKARALNLDNYLASKLMVSVSNACESLAIYEDFEEARRLRERSVAYRTAARSLDSDFGTRQLENIYERLNERYREEAAALKARREANAQEAS